MMDAETTSSQPNGGKPVAVPSSVHAPTAQPVARVYVLHPFQKADYSAGMNPGPGQGGPSGPPSPALIHQLSNSGIEMPSTEVKTGEEARIAVAKLIQQPIGRA